MFVENVKTLLKLTSDYERICRYISDEYKIVIEHTNAFYRKTDIYMIESRVYVLPGMVITDLIIY